MRVLKHAFVLTEHSDIEKLTALRRNSELPEIEVLPGRSTSASATPCE
jgi:hypothetical protein